ncbi:MAG: hypothetical protein H0X36_12990 [Sphingomonadaceae bacterium]|nr:hypothetical protein [Sphingomonadaceae bacterium]
MDIEREKREVDRNYGVFMPRLAEFLPDHRDQWALMRDGEVLGFYEKPGEAIDEARSRFADEIFSLQEVTDERIDLGFYSHVAIH